VLCYLDLDRFKAVNDECGHVAGDSMLREVAALLKDAVRDSETVGRLGGDEFGILLVGCPLEKARQIADDVVRAVADYRFVWRDRIFNIGVSIGLVEVSRESGSLEDALGAANSACYIAKRQGSHVQVYSARDDAMARPRDEIRWLQLLQSALRDNAFELHAQPIVAVDAQSPNGPALEVLLRLKDVSGAMIAPSEFMQAAEHYRLMPHVDRWVVQTALAALGRGALRLEPGRSLLISISGQSLGDAAFLDFVVDCFDRTGVAPDRICFDVIENSVITNIERARRFIGVLHTMGCQFGVADVGRGPSSLANLKSLAPDGVRVDGALLRDSASDKAGARMAAAMIKLARSLGIQFIVEQKDVVATAIDWEVGGEKVLGLKVNLNGSVERMGTGVSSCEDKTLYCGTTPEALLSGLLEGADSEVFRREGLTVLEPISGKLCKLAVHFWRKHGGSRAFEIWYGSASTGPSPAITAFVANAIERTNLWYACMQRGDGPGREDLL
jgi:diguanylate cyclase (GGDEF)-like protein